MKSKLDLLFQEPEDIVREFFPHGDVGSPVPLACQFLGPYVLNESGLHKFSLDEHNEMKVETLYPISFIAKMKNGEVYLTFFVNNDIVETHSHLYCSSTKFHSLPEKQKEEIDRYISFCIMKDLK